MAGHSTLTGASLHEPKGVASANSGEVYVANGSGSGAWGTVPGTLPAGFNICTTAAELQAAANTYSGGVYTLEDDQAYFIGGEIDIGTDRIVLGSNTVVRGFNRFGDQITGTGSPLITMPSSATLQDMRFSCVGGTAIRTTGSGTALCLGVTIVACAQAADIQSSGYFVGDPFSVLSATTTGVVLNASATEVKLKNGVLVVTAGSGIDLTGGSVDRAFIQSNRIIVTGGTGFTTSASSADINSGGAGIIEGNIFDVTAPGVASSGYDTSDLLWRSEGNAGIESSTKNAQAYMHAAHTTTISGASTPVVLNGSTSWVDQHSDQFTVSTSGRVTYNGIETTEFDVSAYISGAANSSTGSPVYNIYIYHYDTSATSGSTITASRASRQWKTTDVGAFAPASAIVTMETGDWVEVWIENVTNTNDFDSDVYNLMISEA